MAEAQERAPVPPVVKPPASARGYSPDGVHLLRTTQQIQYQLSQMADQKASMLLGITFVIFTIAVGQARSGGSAPPALLILGAAAFGAALLTVLAVLPSTKAPSGAAGSDNILFFGAFTKMSQDEYVATLLGTVADTQSVYEAFARDIYQNGRVLAAKKYRLLGYAYRVLLAGLIGSLAAFLGPYVAKWLGL
jgi:hypothetical protein